ncbi:MAG: tetratricopeptide repeat protein [Geitlerinemataceae cyanobacterium]
MKQELTSNDYVQKGNTFRKQGKLDRAIDQYQEALKQNEEFAPAFFQLAVTYEKQMDLENAISNYKRVIQIQQDNHDAYSRLGRVLKKHGHIQEAIVYFQKAIALQSTQPAWIYTSLGDCLPETENQNERLEAYQKAIEIDPDISSSIYKKLLDIFYQRKEYDRAIDLCKKAVFFVKDREKANFYILLAESYSKAGDLNRTIDAYKSAIHLDPSLPFDIYICLGEALKQKRNSIAIDRKKEYEVVVCTTFKNEAPYLLEWIAYHRVIGVDHFILYDNDSTDRTPEIFQYLEKAGIITYISWPNNPIIEDNQLSAYKDAYLRLVGQCKWAAFIDADEFILPHKHRNIKDFLIEYENQPVSGIAINWKLFGSSGHLLKTEGLLMERFTKCAAPQFLFNRRFKTIAKVDKIQEIITVHSCKFFDGVHIYPDGTLVPKSVSKKNPYINQDTIQINHYFAKSKAEWDLKRSRGRATRNINNPEKIRPEKSFEIHDRNEDEDLKILDFLEKTKREIAFLTQVSGLEDIIQKMNDEYTDFKPQIYDIAKKTQFTQQAIDFVENLLKQNPNAKVLEFGSGASTIWLSQHNKNIISIEHDLNWYESVKSVIDREQAESAIDLRLLPRPYHLATSEFENETFDLIIVDGRERVRCIEKAIRTLKKGGILILNDAQKDYYQPVHFLLQDWEFTRTIDSTRETHWWRKPWESQSATSELAKVLKTSKVCLYTGSQLELAKQQGWIGISNCQSDEEHIQYSWQKPFPLPDNLVDVFVCDNFLQHISPHQLLNVVFPELYRILKPGGVLRISLPDYYSNTLWGRSWKDKGGKPYFDPGGGGKWNPARKQVTHGGHVWFPTYEQLESLIELSPLHYCQIDWLHYYTQNGDVIMNAPENLNRVQIDDLNLDIQKAGDADLLSIVVVLKK